MPLNHAQQISCFDRDNYAYERYPGANMKGKWWHTTGAGSVSNVIKSTEMDISNNVGILNDIDVRFRIR